MEAQGGAAGSRVSCGEARARLNTLRGQGLSIVGPACRVVAAETRAGVVAEFLAQRPAVGAAAVLPLAPRGGARAVLGLAVRRRLGLRDEPCQRSGGHDGSGASLRFKYWSVLISFSNSVPIVVFEQNSCSSKALILLQWFSRQDDCGYEAVEVFNSPFAVSSFRVASSAFSSWRFFFLKVAERGSKDRDLSLAKHDFTCCKRKFTSFEVFYVLCRNCSTMQLWT